MKIADENPFRNPDQSFHDDRGKHPPNFNFRKFLNLGFGVLLLLVLVYSLSQQDITFDFSLDKPNESNKKAAKENTNAFTPFHAFAAAHESVAYLWVFSFDRDSAVHLSVIDPLEKKLISHQPFPYSNCKPPYPNFDQCLREGLTVMNEKLWWSHKEGNLLMAFDLRSGTALADAKSLKEKHGKFATGFFKLNTLRDGRCFFLNDEGEKVAFFPYSDKMGYERSKDMDGKFSGSVLKFFVDEGNKGKSDVYVTDAKVNHLEGTIYFAWDYHTCQNYDRNFYIREINRVWKLNRSFINPKLVAENGSEAIILHQETPEESAPFILQAIDKQGSTLWKNRGEVARMVEQCKKIPRHVSPHYKGTVAVFFDETYYDYTLQSIGIDYKTGKVLWQLKAKEIIAILNPKS